MRLKLVHNPNPETKELRWKFGDTPTQNYKHQFHRCSSPSSCVFQPNTRNTKQTIACDTNHPASPFTPNKLHLAFCHLLSTPFALAPAPLLRPLIGFLGNEPPKADKSPRRIANRSQGSINVHRWWRRLHDVYWAAQVQWGRQQTTRHFPIAERRWDGTPFISFSKVSSAGVATNNEQRPAGLCSRTRRRRKPICRGAEVVDGAGRDQGPERGRRAGLEEGGSEKEMEGVGGAEVSGSLG